MGLTNNLFLTKALQCLSLNVLRLKGLSRVVVSKFVKQKLFCNVYINLPFHYYATIEKTFAAIYYCVYIKYIVGLHVTEKSHAFYLLS